jgi:hypothetical protein
VVAAPKIRCDDKGKQQEFAEKKGKNSAGKVCAGKKSDGGGVVLKMTTDCAVCVKTKGSKAS